MVGAEALRAIGEAWRELYERCPAASPFQSPAWLLAWLQAFAPTAPHAVALRSEGRLVGLLPFFIHRTDDGEAGQLTLLGNGISDRLDLLVEDASRPAVTAALAEWLRERSTLFSSIDWRDLPAGSPLLDLPLPFDTAALEAEEPCPVRPLPAEPDQLLAGLDRKRRENLARRGRRLAELGRVEVRVAGGETLAADLRTLLRLHGERWRARGEEGVLANEAVGRFHRLAAPALLEAGLLQLHLLELDGRAIAAHYGLRRGERAYSYIHGFDPAFAAHAPSALLIAAAMKDAVAAGARVFDFLRGREGYKYDWGALDVPQWRRRTPFQATDASRA